MGKKNYLKGGMETGHDKSGAGKFPDCRFCRYHTSDSKGIRYRDKYCLCRFVSASATIVPVRPEVMPKGLPVSIFRVRWTTTKQMVSQFPFSTVLRRRGRLPSSFCPDTGFLRGADTEVKRDYYPKIKIILEKTR
ncbi:MAG: hypothetical protein LUC48_00665 [Clostridiales bacterium]|nr:hypothetical protein [Clostridiales bacterium]